MMKKNVNKKQSQRVCLALDLVNDVNLIQEYKGCHQPQNIWKVITDGIRNSGINVMDIYNIDNRLFMICEFAADMNLDECWAKMAEAPQQDEWASLMAGFQQALPGHKLEWVLMERIFTLNDNQ